MKDGALVTVRSVFGVLGVSVNSKMESDMLNPIRNPVFCVMSIDPKWMVDIRYITKTEFESWPDKIDILRCLTAANKCVAHFEPDMLDHSVDETVLDRVIERLLFEIDTRIVQK